MSINTAHANGGVLIFSGELILLYCKGVNIEFKSQTPILKGTKQGIVYLTSHRVIFKNEKADNFQSMSIPFHCFKGLELKQPVFGANYITGNIKSEPNGGWEGEAQFDMKFNHGGAIEFGRALLEAGKQATRFGGPPPVYAPMPPLPPSGYYPPPPAYYEPCYTWTWVPYQTFPDRPPANSVYASNAPPPYPGLVNAPPMNGANQAQNGKQMEAGYYSQNNPHQVYNPTAPSAPPAYNDVVNGHSKQD